MKHADRTVLWPILPGLTNVMCHLCGANDRFGLSCLGPFLHQP